MSIKLTTISVGALTLGPCVSLMGFLECNIHLFMAGIVLLIILGSLLIGRIEDLSRKLRR